MVHDGGNSILFFFCFFLSCFLPNSVDASVFWMSVVGANIQLNCIKPLKIHMIVIVKISKGCSSPKHRIGIQFWTACF